MVLLQSFDLSPYRAQFLLDFFVATIEMVNTIDNRNAVGHKSGDQILEIRIGTKTYRTGPVPYDWPDGAEGDVRQLESALRQACPHAVSEALVNRTTWVSDTGG